MPLAIGMPEPANGAGAVGEQRYVDAVLRLSGRDRAPKRRPGRTQAAPRTRCLNCIAFLPSFHAGRGGEPRRPLISRRRSPGPRHRADRSRPKLICSVHHQYGNGHTLSFCLAICHSRASPCGSTIRKKMISAPTIMNGRCSTVAASIGSPRYSGSDAQHDRQAPDEGRAEERADQAAEPADDHHEQDQEGLVDVEAVGLRGAEPEEHHQRARRRRSRTTRPRRRAAWSGRAGCRSARPRCPCRAPPSTCGRCGRAPGWRRARSSATTMPSTTR